MKNVVSNALAGLKVLAVDYEGDVTFTVPTEQLHALHLEALEMEQENERLRRVLKFYGEGENYKWFKSDADRPEAFHFVDLDRGKRARKALEEKHDK